MDAKAKPAPKALFGVTASMTSSSAVSPQAALLARRSPGTGKTTIAAQFLLEGAAAGEKGLYITLSETEEELRETAASHGWSIPDSIEIFELVPPESLLDEEPAAKPALFVGPRTWRDDQAHLRGDRAGQAEAGRARQPVRDPPARAELAALSTPDPGAEALFRAQRRDGADARRSDRRDLTTRPSTASRTA